MTTPSRLSGGHTTVLLVLSFFLILLATPKAMAQDNACAQVIDLADRYYEQGRMQEVIALVADCLSDEAADNVTAVRGYRLLALAYLRSDQLGEAKLAVIELLGRDPDYETDPIQDLPTYTALVNNIKVQLALQGGGGQAQPVAKDTDAIDVMEMPETPDETYRPQDRILLTDGSKPGSAIELRGRVGWSSYGGERGDSGNGFFDEYTDNGGVSFAAELAFGVSEYFSVGVQYELGHYATFHSPKGTEPVFPTIALGKSSPWLHYIGVIGRGYIPTGGSVKPYAQLGYLATLALINDKVSVGSGPKIAFGLDIAVDDNIGFYMELEGQVVLPGTAVDLVDRDFGYDLFTGAGIGLRYRLAK